MRTVVGIDPTVGLEAGEAGESGTVAGIEPAEADAASDSAGFDPNATLEDFDTTPASRSDYDQSTSGQKPTDELENDDESGVDLDVTVNELDANVFSLKSMLTSLVMVAGNLILVMTTTQLRISTRPSWRGISIKRSCRVLKVIWLVKITPLQLVRLCEPGVGTAMADRVESTIRDAQEATFDGYDSHPSVNTVDSSVLESANIGQTINPRELSDEEASAWSLAAQGEAPKAGQTVQSGGGPRRTWVDYQFSRLRERAVSTGKEKQNVDDDYRLVRKTRPRWHGGCIRLPGRGHLIAFWR